MLIRICSPPEGQTITRSGICPPQKSGIQTSVDGAFINKKIGLYSDGSEYICILFKTGGDEGMDCCFASSPATFPFWLPGPKYLIKVEFVARFFLLTGDHRC